MKKNEIIISVIKDKIHECYSKYNVFVEKEYKAQKNGDVDKTEEYRELAMRQLCKKNVLLDLIETLNSEYDFDIDLI